MTLNDDFTSQSISVFLKLGRLSARNESIDTATTQRDIRIDSEAIVVKSMVSHERWKEYNFSIESIV